MTRETIASVRAEGERLVANANSETLAANARAASALAALKTAQGEYADLRQRAEQAEYRARDAEMNATLLRGFILAKVTSAELEAMPVPFAEYVRNGPEPVGPNRISDFYRS